MARLGRGLLAALLLAALAGCSGEQFSEAEKATIQSMALDALPALAADPTNRHADEPAAAALGATLFFDQRLSRDGTVSCSTCHVLGKQFQDGLPRAVGVSEGNRRTMPLEGVARNAFLFWDGRRDSLWAQALTPLEDLREHAGTRTGFAHFMAAHFGERYERIFGALPDLGGLPPQAGPFGTPEQIAAWQAMTDAQRAAVDRVFSNIGKAIAAFERSLDHPPTRFDRFARAVASGEPAAGADRFSEEEIAGLKLFIGKANCSTCHTGPRYTDDAFHNTGVPIVPGLPEDIGRTTGRRDVLGDPFNCLGRFSDAGPEACDELRFLVKDGPELIRAYKTPSLRGAASRPPYMHSGQFATLDDVLDHYARAPTAPSGQSELVALRLSERERRQLIAFLRTLGE